MATTVMASMMSSVVAAGSMRARFPAVVLTPRRRALVVRAQGEPDMKPTAETPSTSTSPAAAPTTPTPKPKAKPAKPGLWDALAFSGPAPERINGRLAMVGFVSALAVEASTRCDGLLTQAGSGSGLAWFAVSAAVLSAASLAPVLQGESAEARSKGFWSADAEL
ncbi:hypothetical protein EJB05_15339 [Eragrostis curvula]|uniref:Uncharacterized protein n=1 Tax=Eragrostis curvula TaxID=38414 RepID=A0A5J9W379_9POAL|nr:hypothetical protein EJB05_15339 [Eragrostis curvula]